MKMARKTMYLIVIIAIILTSMGVNLFCYEIYGDTGGAIGGAAGAGSTAGAIGGTIASGITSTVQSPAGNPDYYKPGNMDDASGANKVKDIGNSIIGSIQIIGSILSVVILIIIGVKYMIGSADEKAEYKKAMMPYIIGAIMLFSITNIIGIIANVSKVLL